MDKQQQIINAVQKDSSLSSTEKAELVEKLKNEEYFDELMEGLTGATVGYLISKFFNVSKPSQVLLSIAGFGIGRYLLDASRKHDKFLQYDKNRKDYKINA